jgi:hypothetical protein
MSCSLGWSFALGFGHWALDAGHSALGAGRWAWALSFGRWGFGTWALAFRR